MSDLYLDLRHRIHVVTEWTDVGSEEIERAQARLGLSDEKIARLIPVSAKTWSRYRKRGAIPTHLMPKVAPVMGWELVPFEPTRIEELPERGPAPPAAILVTSDLRESLATLVDLVQRIAETVERNESALGRIEQATLALVPMRRRARPRS